MKFFTMLIRHISTPTLLAAMFLAGCPGGQIAEPVGDAAGARDVFFFPHDGGHDATSTADTGPDSALAPECDRDGDQVANEGCGGEDCNDDNGTIYPGATELCSPWDENCNQQNNEGLDCYFLAAGRDTLYRIYPFDLNSQVETSVNLADPDHGLLDIDIDENGQLLAVTRDGLYTIDSNGDMTLLANVSTPTRTNGMAIDSNGTIFITNKDDQDSAAYTIDRSSGDLSLLGLLDPYVSSGDCVTLKDDSLLMTAPDDDNPGSGDRLVFVNSQTADTSLIGPSSHSKIYGLSASFGFLFGVTDFGEVVEINATTGASSLLFEVENAGFWGAANGD